MNLAICTLLFLSNAIVTIDVYIGILPIVEITFKSMIRKYFKETDTNLTVWYLKFKSAHIFELIIYAKSTNWRLHLNSTRYIPINSRNFEDFMAYAIVVYVITSSNYTFLSIYFYMCGFHCMENLFINTSRLNRTWFPPSYHCLFLSDNTHFFDYFHSEYSWYKQKWDSMIRVLIWKICIE